MAHKIVHGGRRPSGPCIHRPQGGEQPGVPRTWTLRSRLLVNTPPDRLFPFFADARNLGELTPAWLHFAILTPAPIAMAAGTRIDYRISVHGVPLHWQTRITHWQPPHAFVDEQVRGPYAVWRHTHTFTAVGGGTQLDDEVVLRPKGGPLAALLMALLVRRDVERIFRHRLAAMAARFGGDAGQGTVGWDPPTPRPRPVAAPLR